MMPSSACRSCGLRPRTSARGASSYLLSSRTLLCRMSQVGDRAALGTAFGIDLEPGRFAGALVVLAVNATTAIPYHSTTDEDAFQRKLIVLRNQSGARSGRRPSRRVTSALLSWVPARSAQRSPR